MKRLVKNLFAGFVCSALLMGCGGQDLENVNNNNNNNNNQNIVIEDKVNIEVIENIIDEYVDSYSEIGTDNPYDVDYLGIYEQKLLDRSGYLVSTEVNIIPYYDLSYNDVYDTITNVFILDAIRLYDELYENDYYNKYKNFIYEFRFTNGSDSFIFMSYTFYKDTVTRTYINENSEKTEETLSIKQIKEITGYNTWLSINEEPEQTIPETQTIPDNNEDSNITEQNNQQEGIGEQFEINGYNAYYSQTANGEDVLNIHIDDDCLQVADTDAYFNMVGNWAMGCSYVVMTFSDGSNCVIDNNTREFLANQDLNYYRN